MWKQIRARDTRATLARRHLREAEAAARTATAAEATVMLAQTEAQQLIAAGDELDAGVLP